MPKRRLDATAISRNLTIRIADDMRADLERVARNKDWTVGLVVREAIKAGLRTVERMHNGDNHDDHA